MNSATEPLPVTLAIIPGAGGELLPVDAFVRSRSEAGCVQMVAYPGWRRYIREDFTAQALVDELAADIARTSPSGAIGLVGFSLGGHLAYAVGLKLQKMGRTVAGLCAVDSFASVTPNLRPGWRARVLSQALGYLRSGSPERIIWYVRLLFWRAILRLLGERAPAALRSLQNAAWFGRMMAPGTPLEAEVSMRMLIRQTSPFLTDIDRNPDPLRVPATLLRTLKSSDGDGIWSHRCPLIEVVEIPGAHEFLFEPENIGTLRDAFLNAAQKWGQQ